MPLEAAKNFFYKKAIPGPFYAEVSKASFYF
jgi:hypothetical protein